MKNPSKISFRRPRTVVEPPKEILEWVASPSLVWGYCPAPTILIPFPDSGVVADLEVRFVGGTKDSQASITFTPEGKQVISHKLTGPAQEKLSMDGSIEVKKGEDITVTVEGATGAYVSFMFYRGMTPQGYEKDKKKPDGSS